MSNKLEWTEEMKEFLRQMHGVLTYQELSEVVNLEFHVSTTANSVRKAYERFKYPIVDLEKKGPKILALDIETKPLTAYVWTLWNNNVGLSMLEADWSILSWAAKWVGEDDVYYEDQRNSKKIEDDRKLMKNIWKLLDEADIVLTHNGKSFDIPKLNARFILNGMSPPSSFRQIDTKRIAKRHFNFTSNKLEYLTNNLCTEKKKLKHAKYPGFKLWDECMSGNVDAWDEMKAYNIMDIESLEELYLKLAPWDSSINFSAYNNLDHVCSCGNDKLKESGFYYTNACKYQKYRCTKCGREVRSKQDVLCKSKKKGSKIGTVR